MKLFSFLIMQIIKVFKKKAKWRIDFTDVSILCTFSRTYQYTVIHKRKKYC